MNNDAGWRVGSVDRALDWRSKGQGSKSHQEYKKNFEFFQVKKLCRLAVGVPNPHVWKTMYARLKIL